MKKYIFENILNSNIQIIIKAKYLNEALDLLVLLVKYPDDYKIKSQ